MLVTEQGCPVGDFVLDAAAHHLTVGVLQRRIDRYCILATTLAEHTRFATRPHTAVETVPECCFLTVHAEPSNRRTSMQVDNGTIEARA